MHPRSSQFVLAACAAIAAVALPATGHAQLVKRTTRAKPAKQPLAIQFASLVSEALDRPIAPDALTDGLPTAFVALIEANYEGASRANILRKYGDYTQAFERRWRTYEQRRREVVTAIATADKLAASKQYSKAFAVLEGVITPVAADDETGEIATKREVLEVMDAELPALAAMAKLASKLDDRYFLADICAAYRPRRRVLDRDSERLMWIAGQEPGKFTGYGAGLKNQASRAVKLVDEVRHFMVTSDGSALAQGFYWSLDTYGLIQASVFDGRSAKQGDWAFFDLTPFPGIEISVTDSKVEFKADILRRVPFNCKEGNKIDGYDPVANRVIYREECEYRQQRVKASLTANLTAAAPAWARQPNAKLWVLGRVKKAGGSWVIRDARIVDFRFLGAMSIINFGSGASSVL